MLFKWNKHWIKIDPRDMIKGDIIARGNDEDLFNLLTCRTDDREGDLTFFVEFTEIVGDIIYTKYYYSDRPEAKITYSENINNPPANEYKTYYKMVEFLPYDSSQENEDDCL